MGAPLEFCSRRSVVAVLASGVVISLTALTGGVAPAFAKPNTDEVVTTTAAAPQPKAPAEEADPPAKQAPSKAPVEVPAAPSVEAPPAPQTQQAVEPAAPAAPVEPVAPAKPPQPSQPVAPVEAPPPVTQTTTAPAVTSVAPASPTPTVPPVTKVESPSPRVATPPSAEAPVATSTPAPAVAPSSVESKALVPPSSAAGDTPQAPSVEPKTVEPKTGQPEAVEPKAVEPEVSAAQTSSAAATSGEPTVSVREAAKVIQESKPQTLDAPKEDVELARNAKPIEVKADPAPKQDVAAVASSIGLDLGVKGP